HGRSHGTEHGARVIRLRRGNGGVGVTHLRLGDDTTLEYKLGAYAEKCGLPQYEIGPFSRLHRTHLMCDSMRERRVDGVLGDIAAHPEIVCARAVVLRKRSTL